MAKVIKIPTQWMREYEQHMKALALQAEFEAEGIQRSFAFCWALAGV